MKLLITLLFFSTTLDILAQSSNDVICHMTQAEILDVETLREAMAVADLSLGSNDVATGIGEGVIDSSCLVGVSSNFREETINAIRAAINLAIERVTTCFENLRIIEMPDVVSVLHRTRFICNDPSNDGLVASMRRTSRTYNSCGTPTSRFTAGAHRRYEMTISTPRTDLSKHLNRFATTRLNVEDRASFFAHEAMHVLAMNNRSWHNDFTDEEKPLRGCSPSRFEDRIYFTQAACFPESELGQDFYSRNGAYQCPELCLNTLTQVDEEARQMYSASTVPGSERTSSFGPSQVARPYPREEALRICNRIRQEEIRKVHTAQPTP